MSNQVFKRILTLVLCASLVLGAVPVVSADNTTKGATISGVIYESGFVSRWDSFFTDNLTALSNIHDALAVFAKADLWEELDYVMMRVGWGGHGSLPELQRKVAVLESYLHPGSHVPVPGVPDPNWVPGKDSCWLLRFVLGGLLGNFDFEVVQHATYGWVIQEVNSGLILCNSRGAFPYFYEEIPDTGEEAPDRSLGGKWVRIDKVNWNRVNILSEYSFYDIGYALRDYGEDNEVDTRYVDGNPTYEYLISRDRYENGIPFVYCDKDGQPYVNRPDPEAWAQEQDNNWIVDDDGNTSNGQLIDVDSNAVWFPDGTLNFINNLVYDESQKTYYVDASASYDIDNNYYYTYNYHYEYHIDYTSITYIGQTAEYDEVYEYYYQLPDGRSSADLTVEELQALNTQIDVLPYIRSADDTSIRALYHFDGDTRDSSYWSHIGEFKWNKGASITYMDAGAFNGALYLDENEHEFSIKLPSNLGSGDWTVQFRYYQSHTVTPVTDSSISIGGVKVATMDGSTITVGGTSAPVSVGQWQELAFMRSGSQYHFFHNGVLVKSVSTTAVFSDTIDFVFGADQQTYKYFDELRVTNKAVYPTTGYTPSSVPHDTNLALVLPDSQLPVADEYWSFQSSADNLLTSLSLSDWTNAEPFVSSGLVKWDDLSTYSNGTYYSYYSGVSPFKPFFNSTVSNLVDGGTSAILTGLSTSFASALSLSAHTAIYRDGFVSGCVRPTGGLIIPIANVDSNNQWVSYSDVDIVGDLTFSLVDTSANVYSVSAVVPAPSNGDYATLARSTKYGEEEFADFYLSIWGFSIYMGRYSSLALCLCVQPKPGSVLEFVYLEAVKGSSTDLSAEWVESVVVMDKDDLNTPSLAVRTDLDITGYQIGGVRPSLPEKGLVWAMVENGRITSLQIYNGQAWEEIDGRIWTGSRWIPYYAYDVLLLKDMYDIVESDPSLNPIYTETGFWTWLQSAWKDMIARLDSIITALSGGSGSTGVTCSHAYALVDEIPATCTIPGRLLYECPVCEGQYIEALSALGHDWIAESATPDEYSVPADTACPDCGSLDFAFVLDEADARYACTCQSCSKEWVQNALLVKGETTYCCSLCGESYVGTEHPDAAGKEETWTIIDLAATLKDGAWSIVKGVVRVGYNGLSGFVESVGSIGSFFDVYSPDSPDGLYGIMNVGSDVFWQ